MPIKNYMKAIRKERKVVDEYKGCKLVLDTDMGIYLIQSTSGQDIGAKPPITRDNWKKKVDVATSGRPPTSGPGAFNARGNRFR